MVIVSPDIITESIRSETDVILEAPSTNYFQAVAEFRNPDNDTTWIVCSDNAEPVPELK